MNQLPSHYLLMTLNKKLRAKQECTASSPLGRHMGHYKTMLGCLQKQLYIVPQTIISITQLSLTTASPLKRRQRAAQVMLEKEKGHYIDNLQIIQLCEVDLNIVLHTIWGHCLICLATKHHTL